MSREKDFGKRLIWIQWIVAMSFLTLVFRLWQLQIIKGSEYLAQSIRNRTRLQKIQAPRGFVFDARGRPLVKNIPSFNVCLLPQYIKGQISAQERLAKNLTLNPSFLKERVVDIEGSFHSTALKIKEGISREELGLIAQDRMILPGVMIDVVPKRVYVEGYLGAHLLGYVGEVGRKDIGRGYPPFNYQPGDYLGKCGVEQAADGLLRGVDGGIQAEVDASGQRIRVLTEKGAIPGKNVFLTINLDLQRLGEECLGARTGALVALDPRDGRILTMVSHPPFNPNLFSQKIAKRDWESLLADPSCPMINRAIQGQLPPGSIYKVICAIAGLEEGVVDPDTTFYCPGYLRLGNRTFGCWKKGGHGKVNLKRAIISSCDVYFYRLGLRLGVDRLGKYARLFGLGEKTAIALGGERAGFIPTYRWKKERFGESWSAGEVASLAIGQGYNLVTPLQVANLYSAIANGGVLYLPQYMLGVTGEGERVSLQFSPQVVKKIFISPNTLGVIRDALWGVVNSPEGTGWRGRVFGLEVAGKTGTAQVVERGKKGGDRRFSDHAWFVAFAPKDEPRIAVVAVIEHGGHGGGAAAPVVQKFLLGWKNCMG